MNSSSTAGYFWCFQNYPLWVMRPKKHFEWSKNSIIMSYYELWVQWVPKLKSYVIKFQKTRPHNVLKVKIPSPPPALISSELKYTHNVSQSVKCPRMPRWLLLRDPDILILYDYISIIISCRTRSQWVCRWPNLFLLFIVIIFVLLIFVSAMLLLCFVVSPFTQHATTAVLLASLQ